jgi:hypothetical protein
MIAPRPGTNRVVEHRSRDATHPGGPIHEDETAYGFTVGVDNCRAVAARL